MKFCCYCAAPVVSRVPPGDSLPRWVCDECGEIHYQNPKLVLGTIPEHGGRILLCRRAIEPRYGYWTLPAGFMENSETAAQGAARETLEEAGARIELGAPFSMISVPRVNQVHLFYLRAPARPRFQARRGDPGSGAVRRSRPALERHRLPHRRTDAQILAVRPGRRQVRFSRRRH